MLQAVQCRGSPEDVQAEPLVQPHLAQGPRRSMCLRPQVDEIHDHSDQPCHLHGTQPASPGMADARSGNVVCLKEAIDFELRRWLQHRVRGIHFGCSGQPLFARCNCISWSSSSCKLIKWIKVNKILDSVGISPTIMRICSLIPLRMTLTQIVG